MDLLSLTALHCCSRGVSIPVMCCVLTVGLLALCTLRAGGGGTLRSLLGKPSPESPWAMPQGTVGNRMSWGWDSSCMAPARDPPRSPRPQQIPSHLTWLDGVGAPCASLMSACPAEKPPQKGHNGPAALSWGSIYNPTIGRE